jgi:hypothetical protein
MVLMDVMGSKDHPVLPVLPANKANLEFKENKVHRGQQVHPVGCNMLVIQLLFKRVGCLVAFLYNITNNGNI